MITNQKLYTRLLQGLSRPAAAFELRQLFMHRTGWDPHTPLGGGDGISEEDACAVIALAARLGDGEPLQYLLGQWEFYGLPFKVGPGVLIPRPDTETAVRVALELLEGKEAPWMADFCAGSGAIGIAVTKNHPDVRCWSVELSQGAVNYLHANIMLNELEGRVVPVVGDVTVHLDLPPMDLIVSNPPYLTRQELAHVPREVAHEPAMALDGGEDGLRFYRAIAVQARPALVPGGALLFEVGHTQAASVADLMLEAGYRDVGTTEDYAGIPRCVWGFWEET